MRKLRIETVEDAVEFAVPWPLRSPDLNCLDFFLWGHIKSMVYDSPITSEDLVARLSVVSENERGMPDVFSTVHQSMRQRCEFHIAVGGRSIELLL